MINIKQTKREFLLELMNKDIKKVLDLGCGKAIMSRFFVKQGAKAIGIDKTKRCEDFDNFEFVEGNIVDSDFGKNNDLIINSLLLHFFNKEDAHKIVKKMKKATSIDGYNLIISMSNKDDFSNKRPDKFFPSLNELKEIYSDWKIVKELNDMTKIEEHNNQGSHKHNLIFLLVKRMK